MELQGKTVVILLEDQYNEFEFWYPYYRMKEAGATVIVAGTGKDSYASKHGLVAKADRAASQIDPATVDAVIVPGGYAPDLMRRHPSVVDFVRRMDQQGKVVAAICHAGWVLASAGVLRGRRATGFFSIRDDMVNAGAVYVDEEVVRDGNLITSRQPADLPAFCRTIIEALR